MNWKTWVPLMLAIVLGVFAAKVARDAILKSRGVSVPTGKFVSVIVTKTDIGPGHELKAEDVTLSQVGVDNAPASSFKEESQLVGRVTQSYMIKGQPVVEAMLAPTGSGSGLQALVPDKMRAVTIEVNEFTGVGGMVTPGCHVDILATLNEGGNGGQIAKTIVQNVKVTAVGQRTTASQDPPNPAEQFKSVTVLAELAAAEAIELACSTGRPRLVLRGGRDAEMVTTSGITLGELRGSGSRNADPFVAVVPTTLPAVSTTQPITPEQPIVRRESPRRIVKVIRNGVESTVTLRLDNAADPAQNTAETSTESQMEPAVNSTDPFEVR